jgi:hypothetical protein
MAQLLDLKTFTDARGNLTVIEREIPFDIAAGTAIIKQGKPLSASREAV